MYAFLFDENHPDMDAIFGPQCASAVIGAVEQIEPMPRTLILTGSLLHDSICYRLDEIFHEPKDSNTPASGSSGHKLNPDYDIRRAIICDLAETMSIPPSSFSEEGLLNCLASKHIWVVGTPHLSESNVQSIHAELTYFGPYLGLVVFDVGNPVHRNLFCQSLFSDKFIGPKGLFIRNNFGEDPSEALMSEYKSKNGCKLVEYGEFEQSAPPLDDSTVNSERGELSLLRMKGNDAGHRARVARALLDGDHIKTDKAFRFSARKPDDKIEFVIDPRKLTEYLLNIDHPVGGSKAAFFLDTLQIKPNDWQYLADQFLQAAKLTTLHRLELKQYGASHGAYALVTGRNGRQVVVETAWQLQETGPARFITAYPASEDLSKTLTPVYGRVPLPSLTGNARWEAIHCFADAAGRAAGEETIPPPMVLEKWGIIWDGLCGFGWVELKDGRKSFAKWAVKSIRAFAYRPGVHISSPLQTQSIVKNEAYAHAYAEVLRSNGIECTVKSRLD